ncbi:diacylglycerol kinase family protein [Paraurantiacibacter namhicola]|uniref:diacylglycerol kinase family protein n=1 Tax=Paraurantiacibacter namhicola TaxID=645517 RepID=UPI001F1730A4|nr:diacylglycerol kinase family protein [Paraurantiacibacter namhicola]
MNSASGSYSQEAVERLVAVLEGGQVDVAKTYQLPDDDVPGGKDLDDEGLDCLAVFAGDGTINLAIQALSGWDGALLPLPGGTMNLLCARLHGEDAGAEEIAARFAAGDFRRSCEPVVRNGTRISLVAIACGPGTHWYHVREAMRDVPEDGSLGDLANETRDAVGLSVNGPMVTCADPKLGREEGYPVIELEPHEDGLRIVAYTAQDFAGYAKQGLAILMRRFREGPHEVLGHARRVRIASLEEGGMDMSFDGEPASGDAAELFTLERCPVQLVATGT